MPPLCCSALPLLSPSSHQSTESSGNFPRIPRAPRPLHIVATAVIMSNPVSLSNSSKNGNVTSQVPSPSQSQSSSSLGAESYPQRRSGGSGSFGSGLTSRAPPSATRNNQSFRKPHKGQRRTRLADEDAAAESVKFLFKSRNDFGQAGG